MLPGQTSTSTPPPPGTKPSSAQGNAPAQGGGSPAPGTGANEPGAESAPPVIQKVTIEHAAGTSSTEGQATITTSSDGHEVELLFQLPSSLRPGTYQVGFILSDGKASSGPRAPGIVTAVTVAAPASASGGRGGPGGTGPRPA